ncbi:MAG: hypothetical protein PHV97_00140, partial [Candidatus Omnitrophica bacterium]|nr:hypothetical protein [Candidatus Omnitrophota bacterium]
MKRILFTIALVLSMAVNSSAWIDFVYFNRDTVIINGFGYPVKIEDELTVSVLKANIFTVDSMAVGTVVVDTTGIATDSLMEATAGHGIVSKDTLYSKEGFVAPVGRFDDLYEYTTGNGINVHDVTTFKQKVIFEQTADEYLEVISSDLDTAGTDVYHAFRSLYYVINGDTTIAVDTTGNQLLMGDLHLNGGDLFVDSGDLTITPQGDDVLIDGGLTVGSGTQAGDNNLRVEGTSALVGDVTASGKVVVEDSLRSEGPVLFKDKLVVNDSLRVELTSIQKGDATFNGKAVIDDSLRVNGPSLFKDDVTIGTVSEGDNLTVVGTEETEQITGAGAMSTWAVVGTWTYGSGKWDHTTGDATALTANTWTPSANTNYKLVFTITTSVVGNGVTASIGGTTFPTVSTAGTYTYTGITSDTTQLKFTPGSGGTWVGSITACSVKPLTEGDLTAVDLTTNGQIQVPLGNATWPSYAFKQYTNTGLYCNGGDLNLTSAGTQIAQITSSAFRIMVNSAYLGLRSTGSRLYADADNQFDFRSTTNPQAFNVYGTYTGSTNYERAFLRTTASAGEIGTEKGAGGGTARPLNIYTDGVLRGIWSTTGGLRVGNSTPVDQEDYTFNISSDADSDPNGTGQLTAEHLGISLEPASTPTSAYWSFTSTQSSGYKYDKGIGAKTLPSPSYGVSASTGYSGFANTAATSVDGLYLYPDNPASVSTVLQYSPRIRLRAQVWDSTATAVSKTQNFTQEVIPVSGGTVLPAPSAATARMRWSFDHNGGGYSEIMNLYGNGRLNVYSSSTATIRGFQMHQYSGDALGAKFIGKKARGSDGSLTTVVTADTLGQFSGYGYDGTRYVPSGLIAMLATGTVGANRMPGKIVLRTATDAAPSVLTDRVTIDNAGVVTITSGGAFKVGAVQWDETATDSIDGSAISANDLPVNRIAQLTPSLNVVTDVNGHITTSSALAILTTDSLEGNMVKANDLPYNRMEQLTASKYIQTDANGHLAVVDSLNGAVITKRSLTETSLPTTFGVNLTSSKKVLLPASGTLTDGQYAASKAIYLTAGYTTAFGDLVYLNNDDSRFEKTDCDAAATSADVLVGIALEAGITDGNLCLVMLEGTITHDAWNWTTVGGSVWIDGETVGTAGCFT